MRVHEHATAVSTCHWGWSDLWQSMKQGFFFNFFKMFLLSPLAKQHPFHPSMCSLFSHIAYTPTPLLHPACLFFFSSINCCRELHTISASVCCCPSNRDTKNRPIFFTPDISGAQSYCFYWHHVFSHTFSWPRTYIPCVHCLSKAAPAKLLRLDAKAADLDLTCEAPRSHSRCCSLCLPTLSSECTW